VVAFTYDADGNRASKSVTSGGTTTVNDLYQLGHLAEQTDGTGTMLARFSYDSQGVPTSVQVGSDPATAPRYYYVYNGHGDVVALTDASGTSVATYGYDAWGVVTVDTAHFANGWRNPYLYDGRDGARYDAETGLYWLSVRAYDPTLGRFLSHDPLNRAPLLGWMGQPYVYTANNPLVNVDPSGQRELYAEPGTRETRQEARVSRVRVRHVLAGVRRSGWVAPRPRPRPAAPPFTTIPALYARCSGGDAPAWCGRYFDYVDAGGRRVLRWRSTVADMAHHHDYWFLLAGYSEAAGVQAVFYFVDGQKNPVLSVGVNGGMDLGLLDGAIIGFGFGMLLTDGTPSSGQVVSFLKGLTVQVSLGLVIGMTAVISPFSGGEAWETTLSTAAGWSIGASWGWQSGPPPCGQCAWQ
jgi:RHS repeat-associated protein